MNFCLRIFVEQYLQKQWRCPPSLLARLLWHVQCECRFKLSAACPLLTLQLAHYHWWASIAATAKVVCFALAMRCLDLLLVIPNEGMQLLDPFWLIIGLFNIWWKIYLILNVLELLTWILEPTSLTLLWSLKYKCVNGNRIHLSLMALVPHIKSWNSCRCENWLGILWSARLRATTAT